MRTQRKKRIVCTRVRIKQIRVCVQEHSDLTASSALAKTRAWFSRRSSIQRLGAEHNLIEKSPSDVKPRDSWTPPSKSRTSLGPDFWIVRRE